MGALRNMMDFLTGRQVVRAAEQAEVDRALASERARTRVNMTELERQVDGLKGSEARMMDYFSRLQTEAGRGRRGH
jgi:hypothetical protein